MQWCEKHNSTYDPLARHWHWFTSQTQSAGHGQRGRAFASPPGGLYVSLICPWHHTDPLQHKDKLWLMAMWVGLLVMKALPWDKDLKAPYALKWPNDIYGAKNCTNPGGSGGKKLGGVLVQPAPNSLSINDTPPVVISFGLNINTDPDDLPPMATSLKEMWGHSFDTASLFQKCIGALHHGLVHFAHNPPEYLIQHINNHLLWRHEWVTAHLPKEQKSGIFRGIAANGHVLLEIDSVVESVAPLSLAPFISASCPNLLP